MCSDFFLLRLPLNWYFLIKSNVDAKIIRMTQHGTKTIINTTCSVFGTNPEDVEFSIMKKKKY